LAIGSIAMIAGGAAPAMKFDLRNMLIIGVFPGLALLAVASERLPRARASAGAGGLPIRAG
jgi:hypothetical protein